MDNLLGEFMGMVVLITFGCGVNANMSLKKTCGNGGGWICITAGWAFAVLLGVFTSVALGAPQADINPSVTLAKTFAGIYTLPQFFATAAAQLAGGIVGGLIVYLAYMPHWAATEDPLTKRGVFCTAPAIRNLPAAFLTEMIATFFLMFVIWMIFAKPNGPIPPGLGPYFVAMLIFALGLSLGGPTGYAMSGARDLGPRIAHLLAPIPNKADSDWEYAWIPVVAPLCGGVAAYVVAHAFGIV
ncbi:MAG: aquaporin family protein [Schwartzia sp.]|nr:aquaporin family protein [Schwartzia sp. (in: firmicutes)]